MAHTDDTENLKLDLKRQARRRLIGAIALVVLLVIIPPLLMEREPRPPVSTLSVEIPSQNTEPLVPRRPSGEASKPDAASAPKGDAAGTDTSKAAGAASKSPETATKTAESASAAKKEATTPAAKKEAEAKPASKAQRKAPEKVESRADATAGYFVPLGTYSSPENVKQLEAKLGAAHIKFFTEQLSAGNGGTQTRVRAGPFATREAAEKARTQLQGLSLGFEIPPVTNRN